MSWSDWLPFKLDKLKLSRPKLTDVTKKYVMYAAEEEFKFQMKNINKLHEMQRMIDEIEKTFTLSEIRDKCIEYDNEYGCYPDNEFEGLEVFKHLIGMEYQKGFDDEWFEEMQRKGF